MNLYSYCYNDPISFLYSKPSVVGRTYNPILLSNSFGTNCWNMVCNWASNTFGGIVQGTQTTNIILGDDSKSVTFFAENASSWWKFWEYKIGVSINIGRFSYTASTGIGNQSASFGWENISIDFFSEINKVGVGTSYTSGNTSHYVQYYIKPIHIAFALALAFVVGGSLVFA